MRFEGIKALVTGASGGIGGSIVEVLCTWHAHVATADRAGRDCEGDLMDGLPKKVAKKLGGLDVLLSNTGIITRGKINEARDDNFARSMAVNVKVPSRLCRADPGTDFPLRRTVAPIDVTKPICCLASGLASLSQVKFARLMVAVWLS